MNKPSLVEHLIKYIILGIIAAFVVTFLFPDMGEVFNLRFGIGIGLFAAFVYYNRNMQKYYAYKQSQRYNNSSYSKMNLWSDNSNNHNHEKNPLL